jgi:hypothetical protein
MTEIGRNFDDLQKKIKGFNSELKNSQQETKALDKALKLDPTNVNLVKQKYEGFSNQLELNKGKADALKLKMAELNRELESGTISQANYDRELKKLEQSSRLTEIEVAKLEGALKRQNQAIAQAQFGDITKGMQMAQQAAGNLTTMMGSLTTITGLFGATMDNSGSQTMKSMQKAMSGVQAFVGMMPMLQTALSKTATGFQRAAVAATMFMGAAFMSVNLVENWKNMSTIEKILNSLSIAFMIAAAAVTVFHASWSLGIAVGIIAAAVVAGIAMIKSAGDNLGIDIGASAGGSTSYSGGSISSYDLPSLAGSQDYYNDTSTSVGPTEVTINIYNPADSAAEIEERLNTLFANNAMTRG